MRPLLLTLALVGCGSGSSHFVTSIPPSHRTSDVTCDAVAAGACMTSNQSIPDTCASDADCTMGRNGRCNSGNHGLCQCTYDECHGDSECASGQACLCASPNNRCVDAGCRTDADCGAGQYCTPSLDPSCGNYFGITHYACTTPADKCRTDDDCTHFDANFGQPFCAYFPELGYWQCSTSQCAG